jgi:low affinity Fe/Cu permease
MLKRRKSHHASRYIYLLAEFLSTWQGFVWTFLAVIVGIGVGALLQFNEPFMFGFNIILSVAAIVISGIILVSAARSEAALHVKLDYLIEYSKVTNTAIGLEHRDVREIEEERARIEKEAAAEIEDVVEEEVAEQLEAKRQEQSA